MHVRSTSGFLPDGGIRARRRVRSGRRGVSGGRTEEPEEGHLDLFGSVDQRDFVRVDVVQYVITGNQVPIVV